ncbi:glycosyltransferase family 2 protein [Arcticibacter eurypsychrophilus]|uniref:glycosyltransferase family 2 protein n=1 Tax=Arcticibacter eurypsychrophilus TaxID=1434752 RepID=UPI00084D15EB|nr:glycosyltransferase family A protein [Arcticibacter eurypsychrophilus]
MNNEPYFSVIIPVHNKLPHLERSVFSVLRQTYQNFELIIIDDASTDGSSEKLTEFTDPKISLYTRTEPGPGGYKARNVGIDHARYPWICFLDADDEWSLDLLETIKNAIVNSPDIECVTWGYYNTTGTQKKLDKTSVINADVQQKSFALIDLFRQKHTLWTGAVSFKKDLLVRAGKFPESGYKRGGDVDTWIRCLWQSKGNLWINKPLSYYYLDAVNMVTKSIKRESLYIFSPFLFNILRESKNTELEQAIKDFQNKRIYSILRGQIVDKQPLDYQLLRKMNLTSDSIILVSKLMLKKMIKV